VFTAILLGAPLWAQAVIPVASPRVIGSPGSYQLVADIDFDATRDWAINITTGGVTLDLNGHRIKGPGGKQGTGLLITGARGVTVRNGLIADTAFGVIVNGSHNVVLRDLLIRGQALPVLSAPPEIGIMIVNARNVVVESNSLFDVGLGIFVRGGMSAGNRIANNTVTSTVNGVFGICYNPADTGTGGPRGDLIYNNLITGFDTGIQISAGSLANVFRENTIAYITAPFVSNNPSNLDLDNSKVKLP